jgi:hypothetical protein
MPKSSLPSKRTKKNIKKLFISPKEKNAPLIRLQRTKNPSREIVEAMAIHKKYYKGEGGGFP